MNVAEPKPNRIFWVIMGIAVCAVLYGLFTELTTQTTYKVKYTVDCLQCDITYTNEKGKTVKVAGSSGKWNQQIVVKRNQRLKVTAKKGDNDESITAAIYVNDRKLRSVKSRKKNALIRVSGKAREKDSYLPF